MAAASAIRQVKKCWILVCCAIRNRQPAYIAFHIFSYVSEVWLHGIRPAKTIHANNQCTFFRESFTRLINRITVPQNIFAHHPQCNNCRQPLLTDFLLCDLYLFMIIECLPIYEVNALFLAPFDHFGKDTSYLFL